MPTFTPIRWQAVPSRLPVPVKWESAMSESRTGYMRVTE